MKFLDWFKRPFKKYTDIEGRATRSEYWYFVLGNFLVSFLIGLIISPISFKLGQGLSFLWTMFTLVPSITVGVRRLHDSNHSGWNLLWNLIPFFGWIYLIYLLILQSDSESNDYGTPEDLDMIEREMKEYDFAFKQKEKEKEQ